MARLSKSKLIAYRQCPRRLWLEVHRPDLVENAPDAEARMRTGNQVGEIARRLYDPEGTGATLDIMAEGVGPAIERTRGLLQGRFPIFEAGLATPEAHAFADVMLPVGGKGSSGWRIVEVKSSTSVKDYHRDDAAIQAFIARQAGVALEAIGVAHIDSGWSYPGGGDYSGLLVEADLTNEVGAREAEVADWIREGAAVARQGLEPAVATGAHCNDPFACGFYAYCRAREPQAEHPVEWLPKVQSRALKAHIEDNAITDLADVPDDLLNDMQRRVKAVTLRGKAWFDARGAAAALAPHPLPACFLDFETVQLAVPIWAGTRPYQQIPFQFSLHRLAASGAVTADAFLDLSGDDPRPALAAALIVACGSVGPVFAYNASFEAARIRELADMMPAHRRALDGILARIVDLLPVTRAHYYHPEQRGSWSIKAVLPTIAPDLHYEALDGVKDGAAASAAYVEAIDPATSSDRREAIRRELLAYCHLDTLALVRVWQMLAGRPAATA